MIRFQCPCGRLLDVGNEFAGKQVRCPSCQAVSRVPVAPSSDAATVPMAHTPVPAAIPAGDFAGTGLPPMSQRDLNHERHIRAISFWNRLAGIFLILGGVCGMAGTGFMASKGGGAAAGLLGGLMIVNLFLGAAYYVVGHYLWHYHNWARWTMVFLAAIGVLQGLGNMRQPGGVFAVLIPGVWAGAILWALLSPNAVAICSPSYRELVARTSHERVAWWTSAFFWLPLALVGLLCGGMMLFGAALGLAR